MQLYTWLIIDIEEVTVHPEENNVSLPGQILFGSFKEESVDQEVRSQQKSLLLWCRTVWELKLHKACLVVDVTEMLLWNFGHSSNGWSVAIGVILGRRVDSAGN
jgi:hypothetical protein